MTRIQSLGPHLIKGMLITFTVETVLPLNEKNPGPLPVLVYQLLVVHKISFLTGFQGLSEAVHQETRLC